MDLFAHPTGDVGQNLTILMASFVKKYLAGRGRVDAGNTMNVRAPYYVVMEITVPLAKKI